VSDYAADRIEFVRTGKIEIRPDLTSLNLSRVARAARRIVEAAREMSSDPVPNPPKLAIGRKHSPYTATGFAPRC
jgi:hypothetical protein